MDCSRGVERAHLHSGFGCVVVWSGIMGGFLARSAPLREPHRPPSERPGKHTKTPHTQAHSCTLVHTHTHKHTHMHMHTHTHMLSRSKPQHDPLTASARTSNTRPRTQVRIKTHTEDSGKQITYLHQFFAGARRIVDLRKTR